ncbi:MAG: YCF48-related protein [Thermoleophilia bacterium]|nr:YCF48-related protein [Thermoleophilia bacterium]
MRFSRAIRFPRAIRKRTATSKVLTTGLVIITGFAAAVGLSWVGGGAQGASASLPTNVELRAVDVTGATEGWAAGVLTRKTGEQEERTAFLAYTKSGGADWEIVYGAVSDQGKKDEWVGRAVNALDFVDESHGWAVLDDGTILATADGGKNWVLASEGSFEFRDNNFSYSAISMADRQHGCAVGSWVGFIGKVYPRVAFTTDGENWASLELKGFPGYALSSVHMVSATEAWALGTAVDESGVSLLLHTSDGGATWEDRSRVLPEEATGLTAIWFADGQHGWIVGRQGKVFVTADGGASWWRQNTGVAADLLAVRFNDRWVGWVVGDKGALLGTTDGGRSWTRISGGPPACLRAVGVGYGRVWVVGDQAAVWTGEIPDGAVGQDGAKAQTFFNDISGNSYATAIESLALACVVDGFKDGTYRPDEPAKRAQVAKMTARLLGLAASCGTSVSFADLGAPDSNGYPHDYVQALYCLGALDKLGATGGSFGPWEPVRRDQAIATVIAAAAKVYPQAKEHNGLIEADLAAGIQGADSSWDVSLPITRAELAQVLYNLKLVLDSLP